MDEQSQPMPKVSSTDSQPFVSGQRKQLVAIAIPVGQQTELSAEERISVAHLSRHLHAYDRFIVRAHNCPLNLPDCGAKVFDPRFFGSAQAYTRLMLSRRFYEAFADYEFVLIYHLDALVFSSRLTEWCELGYDYIGAPWLKTPTVPSNGFSYVGNGGFSLRRVSSMLKVIDSSRAAIEPDEYWSKYFVSQPTHARLLNRPRRWLKHLSFFNNVRREMATVEYNEDLFWARRATHYYPEFRIAPVNVALRFAFECAPRYCFEQNQRQLPFGCHAWNKYDRAFWQVRLLK